jgi:hypothetical protein
MVTLITKFTQIFKYDVLEINTPEYCTDVYIIIVFKCNTLYIAHLLYFILSKLCDHLRLNIYNLF